MLLVALVFLGGCTGSYYDGTVPQIHFEDVSNNFVYKLTSSPLSLTAVVESSSNLTSLYWSPPEFVGPIPNNTVTVHNDSTTTTTTFTSLKNASLGDSGNYTLTAVNVYGQTSLQVEVKVLTDCPTAKFTGLQPSNFKAVEGYNSTLRYSFDGSYPPSSPLKIWVLLPHSQDPAWLNGIFYPPCGCLVKHQYACSVGTNPNDCCRFELIVHITPHLNESDTKFSCTKNNFTDKETASMYVAPSPKVLESPHDVNTTVGSKTNFTCDFKSTNDTKVAQIHWLFNGRDLAGCSRFKDIINCAVIQSTSKNYISSTLTIYSVQANNAGLYTCYCSYDTSLLNVDGVQVIESKHKSATLSLQSSDQGSSHGHNQYILLIAGPIIILLIIAIVLFIVNMLRHRIHDGYVEVPESSEISVHSKNYGATGQSKPFESDGNQVSKSSRTGENTTLKTNTSEDYNSVEGESQISKPDKSAKIKPSGSTSTKPVDVHKQCQHNHDFSSSNSMKPTQVDKITPCNKHNGYKDTQTDYTKQTNAASNITQDGSSGQKYTDTNYSINSGSWHTLDRSLHNLSADGLTGDQGSEALHTSKPDGISKAKPYASATESKRPQILKPGNNVVQSIERSPVEVSGQLISGQEPIVVSKEDLTPNHQKANSQNDTQQVDHNTIKPFDKILSGNGQPATTTNDVMDDVADPRQLPTGPLSLDSLSTDVSELKRPRRPKPAASLGGNITTELSFMCIEANMILKQLAHLIKLDISGCDVTDQGTDMIAEVLLKTTSLKEFNIANAKLTTTVAIKILTALEKIYSLQILKLNNNDIEDEAANSIANVISNNHLLQKLNISCNKFSARGLFPVIQTLSVSKNIKLFDISANFKNYSSLDEKQHLGTILAKCSTLQELNISNNCLTFTDILKITQAFRSHPTLQILNMSNNIISYFLECEFLMDLILSTNHILTNVNICGRNIRPRFNDDCLFFPQNCDENSNRFMLQNLYISQYTLLNKITPATTVGTPGIHTDYIGAKEKCPVSCQSIVSYYVDHSGGVFYNQEHDFAIVIPANAVSQGESVQIQATASRFIQCKLPDGYHPISSHFWFSACYTFKLPVYLIMSHYAKIENLENINNLCVLHACDHDVSSEEESVMQVVSSGVYFDYEISYCVFATDHFCSICLGKNNKHIPGKFVSFLYTNETDREYLAEVCFCPAIGDCIKVTEKQYDEKQWKRECSSLFYLAENEKLLICCSSKTKGWSVKQDGQPEIPYDDFKYWDIDVEGLENLERSHAYPPRFRIRCFNNENVASYRYMEVHLDVIKNDKNNDRSCIGLFLLKKYVTEVHKNDSSSDTVPPDQPVVSHYSEYCFKSEYRVLKNIRREFGAKWKYVGYGLDLEDSVINTIELNEKYVENQAFEMLREWIQRDVQSCYCKLIAAMETERLNSGVTCLKYWIKRDRSNDKKHSSPTQLESANPLHQHKADFEFLVDVKILADVLVKNNLLTQDDMDCLQLPAIDESKKVDHAFVYHKMVGLGEEGYKKFLSCLMDPYAGQHAGHIILHKILSTSQQ